MSNSNGEHEQPNTDDSSDLGVAVPFVWEVPEGMITRHANHFIAQSDGVSLYLTFFEFIPPLIIGSAEQRQAQVAKIKEIRPTAVARLVVQPDLVEEMIGILQEQLRKYNKQVEGRQEADDEAESGEVSE